jgi:hypothetical protein
MERKLSTIFASDVVGFSKKMVANEESIGSINAPSCHNLLSTLGRYQLSIVERG